eukprot:935732-Amphidinium_carterae.1
MLARGTRAVLLVLQQVTMLPVVLFQTRFEAMDCHGFAETYEVSCWVRTSWQTSATRVDRKQLLVAANQ